MQHDTLLVISPSPGIGDFIVRIPAIKLLATRFRITLICSLPEKMRAFAEMCLADKQIELVFTSSCYRKSNFSLLYGHWESLSFALGNRRQTVICVLMSDENSCLGIAKYTLISMLSCRAMHRFAIQPFFGQFPFHENINAPVGLQKMARYFSFAQSILATIKQPTIGTWDTYLPQLKSYPISPYIILAPGGKFKRQWWPYFDKLAKWLHENRIRTIIVGAKDENELIERVRQPGQETLIGEDLVNVAKLIELSTAVVCNDSGLLHLAVWQGVRVVAICGPHFAATWTGYPEDRVIQLYDRSLTDHEPAEDAEFRVRCLENIGHERVIEQVSNLLKPN
jgi:ADP-heptose:LPS heptosyltransferase